MCRLWLVDNATENQTHESEVVRLETEENAQKLVEFLRYSKIEQVSYSYDETDQAYVVTVNENVLKEAKKLFQAFYIAETENEEKATKENAVSNSNESSNLRPANTSDEKYEDKEYEDEEFSYEANKDNNTVNDLRSASKSTVYVKKADQFKDLRSTGYIFLVVGIGGLIVLLLNILGIFTFYQGYFAWTVMGVLFTIFLIVGFGTLKHSKQVQGQIADENTLTNTINTWLEKTITQEVLNSVIDPSEADEINYFKQTEYIKKGILDEFDKDLDDSYVDLLVEEFYNQHFTN